MRNWRLKWVQQFLCKLGRKFAVSYIFWPIQISGGNSNGRLQLDFSESSSSRTRPFKCNTCRWQNSEPPSYNAWIQKVWELYQMKQITYPLRLQKTIFLKRWSPVMPLILQLWAILNSANYRRTRTLFSSFLHFIFYLFIYIFFLLINWFIFIYLLIYNHYYNRCCINNVLSFICPKDAFCSVHVFTTILANRNRCSNM